MRQYLIIAYITSLICLGLLTPALGDMGPVFIKEVMSREVSIQVGGIQPSGIKEVFSREASIFINNGPVDAFTQGISRELSIVVTSIPPPHQITVLQVSLSPTGDRATLDWSAYNQWAEMDIVRFDIYYTAEAPFDTVPAAGLQMISVPGGSTSATIGNLPEFTDHYFAVVAVDALGNFNPAVTYAAGYVFSPEVVSREVSLFVENGSYEQPYAQSISREVSILIDVTPPVPPTNFSATATSTDVRLNWTHSISPDIDAYRIYWDNGSGVINYSSPYATVYYPESSFNASFYSEGTYKFGIRAVDQAGNEEPNTDVVVTFTVTGFNLTVSVEYSSYDRGQNVPISGTVKSQTDSPIVNVLVVLDVERNGYRRSYQAYTNAGGQFSYIFQPLSNEAGSYTVRANVLHEGLEKNATTGFNILGLMVQPLTFNLSMSMNSSRTIDLTLKNIGNTDLTDIQMEIVDQNAQDPLTGNIIGTCLLAGLNPGASVIIPVMIHSDPGNPPTTTSILTFTANSAEGSVESANIRVDLHEAKAAPTISPDPLMIGLSPLDQMTKTVTLKNEGFASMENTVVSIANPAVYNWISIINGQIGVIDPSESKDFQIFLDPPDDIQYGIYDIQLNLQYNGEIIPIILSVAITSATEGSVAFQVYDDRAKAVADAEVNLISKVFHVYQTPDGKKEYNDIITARTDADGYVLFESVPTGQYRYLINAQEHDPGKGELTVEPGTNQSIEVILVTNLVGIDFSVVETTIEDEYNVTLQITYTTDLIKPTLYAEPSSINLSFYPDEIYEGTLTITNTSNHAPVRDILFDATQLDLVDQEVELVFENGTKTFTVAEIGPKESVQVAFHASIPDGPNARLNSRYMGNILVSGNYTFTLEGKAYESITKTPVPVYFWKPQELKLPYLSFVNDETDGNLNDLEYRGTSYRLTVQSNRNETFTFDKVPETNTDLKAVSHIIGGLDSHHIINQNEAFWTADFNSTTPFKLRGDSTTFDIIGLQEALEAKLVSDRSAFLSSSHYIGFFGQWADRAYQDAYLVPISITTIKDTGYYGDFPPPGGGRGGGYPPPPSLNEHGEVKIEIDQKITMERQAFNATLNLAPNVDELENVTVNLNIQDTGGADASSLFFVIVTRKSGISTLDGTAGLSDAAEICWQIIPSSEAGGDLPEGLDYEISATIGYIYDSESFSYEVAPETVRVQPMPKLIVDYYLPFVVMADKPGKIKVHITNTGAGPANKLLISSAQPRIVENFNNLPIDFVINGSSCTADESGYQDAVLGIDFGDLQPAGQAEGYWLLTTNRDGFYIEFNAAFSHKSYLGIQLDPLIQEVNTHFVPAIGGRITQGGLCSSEGYSVEVRQDQELKGKDIVNASGAYFISDLEAGDYLWVVKDASGTTLTSRDITVVKGQPTATINEDIFYDTEPDGLRDCWEQNWFKNLDQGPDDDYDNDGLTNKQEHDLLPNATDPTKADSDGDTYSDGDEVAAGTDPLNRFSYPIHLKKGYNLISIPEDVSDLPDLKDWLPIIGDSSEIEKVMGYNPQTGKYITLFPESSENPQYVLQGGEGLIVYAKQD
ncbi:MAG: hypothetical protein JW786_13195, partial [Desulfobacterales bacterium]|nr:hypothetical protein [Desulfobacterales bacterium]